MSVLLFITLDIVPRESANTCETISIALAGAEANYRSTKVKRLQKKKVVEPKSKSDLKKDKKKNKRRKIKFLRSHKYSDCIPSSTEDLWLRRFNRLVEKVEQHTQFYKRMREIQMFAKRGFTKNIGNADRQLLARAQYPYIMKVLHFLFRMLIPCRVVLTTIYGVRCTSTLSTTCTSLKVLLDIFQIPGNAVGSRRRRGNI